MMGMDVNTLRALGLEAGLSFEPGLSKSKMVMQLEQHQASGWMETNSQLLHATEEGGFDHMQGFTGHEGETISDAARVAQSLAGAGYTETFHHVMGGGKDHHVEALHSYMEKLGVSADDVWKHMPKANPNIEPQPFNYLKGYLNNHWNDYQDIMPPLQGHYAGDIMAEYATNKGNVGDSYNHLAHLYLNKAAYDSENSYNHDVGTVASRLASAMGGQFLEVAHAAANGGKVGYHSILPQIGSDVVSGTRHPREPLNAAGLPLGSYGSAVGDRSHYSLVASLTGRPEDSGPASSAIRQEVSETMRSLASSYKGGGETGMNPYRHQTSDYDMIMDSATRYVDIEDARSGYNNLDSDRYSGAAIRSVIENNYDQLESQVSPSFDPASRARQAMASFKPEQISSGFTAEFGNPTNWNPARSRIESKRIADLDAAHANFRDVADGDRYNPIHFHNLEQGSREWFDFRSKYDITGSTVGALLGSSFDTRPWAALNDRLGLERGDKSRSKFQERLFALGHKREDEARIRVSERLGIDIEQVGAITNDQYPGMMYSPDGLIGDDALWEHKAPERAGKYADLLAGDHPDYMDQIQMGMTISGRKRTLFSQTIGDDTRDQWIEHDPTWYERNQNRLNSIRGRLAVGREFVANNSHLEGRDLIDGVRSAMAGDGIWKDVRQKSDRGYSPTAGTPNDPFIGLGGSTYSDAVQPSNYIPNFVTGAGNGLMNVPQPDGAAGGAETGMALAVKQGVLAAREEVKRGEAGAGAQSAAFGQEDADFDDLGQPRGWSRRSIDNAFGNGGGNGGGGGRNPPPDWTDKFGRGIESGIMSGSLRGLQGGFMRELSQAGPIGQTIGLGIGAVSIGGEIMSTMNDYLGTAQDFGSNNPIQFDAQQQGMEMLGLNKAQAQHANETVHSVYNRMANGDPSGAVQMSVATRGLLSLADVRESGGDPIKLAATFRERALARGWSQERIAGAADMAGLAGFARTVGNSDEIRSAAEGLDDTRGRQDTSDFNQSVRKDNAVRAAVSPDYNVQRYGAQNYGRLVDGMSDVMARTYNMADKVERASHANDFAGMVRGLESNGRDYDSQGNPIVSKTGAKYGMQVLPSTARDPGYGIKPATSDTPEEYNRVGRELLDKMVGRYNGDLDKAAAAYTDGAGTVDAAVREYGADWLKHVPAQAQKRVSDLHRLSAGADTFRKAGSSGATVGTINVNVTATVNGREARANANVNGQSQSHEINVNNGSVQQRR